MAEPEVRVVDGERIKLSDSEKQEIQKRWESNRQSLSETKQQRVKEIKERAKEVLSETDWYITREQETGEAIPQDVLDHRSQVRTDSDTFESEVNALESVEDVLNYEYSYPDPPQP